ncbi:putative glycoprotein [Hubei rhabdo-like virus 3]|uniref:Putative glycoprotein n=1 Tax=Hubei rhabdo-like virus 3 TaxID=1923187 RepID=A0A1L3KMP8_9MONO|nr:putative glycoprotein [Hubei rhabdo-like virus 3]APG78690.1 putative glycoprotein [Hubei rhabdo-like virus 3]
MGAFSSLCLLFILIGTSLSGTKTPVLLGLNHGLLLEPYGAYMSHYGFNYIPISFSIPTELPAGINPCVNKSMIELHHKSVLQFISNLVPNSTLDRSSGDRKKRWIPLISGILGSGIAIWNRVSIQSMEKNMDTINRNIQNIYNHVKTLTSTTNRIIDDNNRIHHLVSEIISAINKVSDDVQCVKSSYLSLSLWESSWTSLIVNLFVRASNAALTGKVTPDLLSASNLQVLLQEEATLHESLYTKDPTLVYELSSFVPTIITSSPPVIIGIMVLPKISLISSGHVYTVNSVPWLSGEHAYKIDRSGTVVISHAYDVWIPDPIECISHPGLLICPKKFFTERPDLCIKNILSQNKTDDCNILVKSRPLTPIALQLKTGVLLSAFDQGTASKIVQYKNKELRTSPLAKSDHPNYFFADSGHMLMVEDKIYQLTELSHPYDFSVQPIDLANSSIDISQHLVVPDWTEISHVKDPPNLLTTLSSHDLILYIIIVFFFSTFLVIYGKRTIKGYCMRKKNIRKRGEVSNFSNAHQMMSLH